MQLWSLGNSLADGTYVHVYELPFWAWAVQEVPLYICEGIEKVTGFCLIAPPGWMYKLRWGPCDEEYGLADRSIGHITFMFGQWFGSGFGAWKHEKTLGKFPVTAEWVKEHCPDAGWPWDGSDIDVD